MIHHDLKALARRVDALERLVQPPLSASGTSECAPTMHGDRSSSGGASACGAEGAGSTPAGHTTSPSPSVAVPTRKTLEIALQAAFSKRWSHGLGPMLERVAADTVLAAIAPLIAENARLKAEVEFITTALEQTVADRDEALARVAELEADARQFEKRRTDWAVEYEKLTNDNERMEKRVAALEGFVDGFGECCSGCRAIIKDRDVALEHIKTCARHPLSAALARIAALESAHAPRPASEPWTEEQQRAAAGICSWYVMVAPDDQWRRACPKVCASIAKYAHLFLAPPVGAQGQAEQNTAQHFASPQHETKETHGQPAQADQGLPRPLARGDRPDESHQSEGDGVRRTGGGVAHKGSTGTQHAGTGGSTLGLDRSDRPANRLHGAGPVDRAADDVLEHKGGTGSTEGRATDRSSEVLKGSDPKADCHTDRGSGCQPSSDHGDQEPSRRSSPAGIKPGPVPPASFPAAPQATRETPLHNEVAELLHEIGWRDSCDAQWTNLGNSLPRLAALLSNLEPELPSPVFVASPAATPSAAREEWPSEEAVELALIHAKDTITPKSAEYWEKILGRAVLALFAPHRRRTVTQEEEERAVKAAYGAVMPSGAWIASAPETKELYRRELRAALSALDIEVAQ